jgi:multicomponent Na+:H+ antiporter subunit C
MSGEEATALDEARPQSEVARDTDLPDELDALPGFEGSR